MRVPIFVVVTVCVCSSVTHGQDRKPNSSLEASSLNGSSQLQVTSTTDVPLVGGLVLKGRCDEQGNIYARAIDHEASMQYHATTLGPIQVVRPNGSLAGTIKLTDASPSISPDLSARDFFVAGDGRVYEAAWSNANRAIYVVEFSSDQTLKGIVRLDAEFFMPYQIAVFKSGEFLLSGTLANSGGYQHTPFTAVFASDGRVIKRVYETEDEELKQKAERKDPSVESQLTESGNTAVWHGDVALGSDGNAYLLRATSPALIYVISPKGEVIRKLRVESPSSRLVA